MDSDRTLSTQRTLPFSPQALYGAFADPALLARWWGPAGFTNTFETFDFREGGRWVFTMHSPHGQDYANQSLFTRLVPGEVVVIRHDCAPFFTLTVSLSPVPGGTQLRWDQAFDDAATAQAVKAIVGRANEENLDRLTAVLAGAAPEPLKACPTDSSPP
ncbi:SRPBCC domain-containing protein [Ideonella livida]|uniref:Polyketide cyclase n=1 Tax=Ideonella livida TaxID=2707176 RepID=A0A7C9TKJ0_9BURK|nr:SRPBCC domain-containing protein [Ideonella livida]NDY92859.1 polyketide cyclase [Ideonella livida]